MTDQYFQTEKVPVKFREVRDVFGKCFYLHTSQVATVEQKYQGQSVSWSGGGGVNDVDCGVCDNDSDNGAGKILMVRVTVLMVEVVVMKIVMVTVVMVVFVTEKVIVVLVIKIVMVTMVMVLEG